MMPNKVKLTDKQKERLHEWANELRATDKHQGQDALRNPSEPHETFCCLGIYGMMRKPDSWEYDETHSCWELQVGDNKENTELPLRLKRELGLHKQIKTRNVAMWSTNHRSSDPEAIFMQLNDDAQWSFKKIADEVDHYANTGTISEKAQKAANLVVVEYEPE
jgi:hypothetical protein